MYAKCISSSFYQGPQLRYYNRAFLFSANSFVGKPCDWVDWARKENSEWMEMRGRFDIVRHYRIWGSRNSIGKGLLQHIVLIRWKNGTFPTIREVSRSVFYDVHSWGLRGQEEIKHLQGPFYLYRLTTEADDNGVRYR